MMASASRNFASITTILPRSICCTSPESSSPTLSVNSSRMRDRSPSRTRWMMRCFAACTAVRPNVSNGTSSSSTSPTWKSESSNRASSSDTWEPFLPRLHHRAQQDDLDRALQLVDADLRTHVGPVALHQRGVQAIFQQLQQVRALELLGARQLTNRGGDIGRIRHLYHPANSEQPQTHRRTDAQRLP